MKIGRRAKWLGLLAVVTVGVVTAALALVVYDFAPVSRVTYGRVRLGMTEREIEQALGVGPLKERQIKGNLDELLDMVYEGMTAEEANLTPEKREELARRRWEAAAPKVLVWEGERVIFVTMHHADDDRTVAKGLARVTALEPTVLERVVGALGALVGW